MKKLLVAGAAVMTMAIGGVAGAAEVKMVGTVQKIEVAGGTAMVTLKDTKSGNQVKVTVKDELTIDKFKDKRIVEGDEVRVKYDDGDSVVTIFRKTAGC
jgi:hypothetical protein